jgi:hypothetical protein
MSGTKIESAAFEAIAARHTARKGQRQGGLEPQLFTAHSESQRQQ